MNQNKDSKNFTTIAISNENYKLLKRYGKFGESFNDIVSNILKHSKPQKEENI
jgi:predicted CopG family antitoxin